MDSVNYLGYIFDKDGVRSNTEKTCAIIDAPTPVNVKQVQSFGGYVTISIVSFVISVLYCSIVIIYHDFLPTPRRGSHVKSGKTSGGSTFLGP